MVFHLPAFIFLPLSPSLITQIHDFLPSLRFLLIFCPVRTEPRQLPDEIPHVPPYQLTIAKLPLSCRRLLTLITLAAGARYLLT